MCNKILVFSTFDVFSEPVWTADFGNTISLVFLDIHSIHDLFLFRKPTIRSLLLNGTSETEGYYSVHSPAENVLRCQIL